MQGVHFVFWFFVLFLIEADLGKRLRKCWNCCRRLSYPKLKDDIKLDIDVQNEAERVAVTPNE